MTVTELLVVLALFGLLVGLVAPAVVRYRQAAAGEAAARELALLFRSLRHRAVAEKRSYGIWFRETREGWTWSLWRDGDRDGIRRRDILRGRDGPIGGPWKVQERWPGVRFQVPPGPDPYGPPPTRTPLRDGDPVRFGPGDLVGFSALGASSSGSLYLRSGNRQYAVVVYGPTVRVRVWELRAAGWIRR